MFERFTAVGHGNGPFRHGSATLILKGSFSCRPVLSAPSLFHNLFHGRLALGGNGSGRGGLYAGDSTVFGHGGVSN